MHLSFGDTLRNVLSVSAVSVSDEARAEVNGLKASHFFSLAERLNVGATPFIWLFIRPPWSVSGSCCKAVVHESLRAECQLQGAGPGEGPTWGRRAGRSEPHRVSRVPGPCKARCLMTVEVQKIKSVGVGASGDEPAGEEASQLGLPGSPMGAWAANALTAGNTGPRLLEAWNWGAALGVGCGPGRGHENRWTGKDVPPWKFSFHS